MNTIRELIIQAILTRAEDISAVASPLLYSTEIGSSPAFRARPKVDPDDLPCVDVWPQPEEALNKNGMVLHKMPVKIEGVAHFGAEEPSVVSERILGDLIRCFTSPTWTRVYMDSIVYTGGGTESYPEEGSVSVGAFASFMVTYWTKIGDPYSQ